jgi:hypothetical protein
MADQNERFKFEAVEGPIYPDLGADVAKLRRGSDRQKHGAAVLAGIRRLNKPRGLRRPTLPRPLAGAALLAAIRQRQHDALEACAARPRAEPPGGWQAAYDAAMAAKRLHTKDQAQAAKRIQRNAEGDDV